MSSGYEGYTITINNNKFRLWFVYVIPSKYFIEAFRDAALKIDK